MKSVNKERNNINDFALQNLAKRLAAKHVGVRALVERCAALDRNRDGIIHVNDLEDVLIDYLGVDNISRREVLQLGVALRPSNSTSAGDIHYAKLADLLEIRTSENQRKHELDSQGKKEQWYDPSQQQHHFHHRHDRDKQPPQHAMGSIGHYLENIAHPAEVNNFHLFMQCMEEYQHRIGLKCSSIENGFVVPMGPDLKVKVSFLN